MASISEEFHVYPSVVRGHHIYKRIWTPDIGELLNVITEDSNEHDAHAVAVLKSDHIVGHVPRSISNGMKRVNFFVLAISNYKL